MSQLINVQAAPMSVELLLALPAPLLQAVASNRQANYYN